MLTVNLFTSGRHTQPLIKALKEAKNIKLVNLYSKLPDLPDKTDVFIVADFGQIIPQKVLEIPKHGCLGIHPSLLPKYRGPSPVQYAIMNGEKETGLTIFKMDEKVDHGPIIAQFKEKIRPDDTAESLYQRLFAAGGQVLITILPAYIERRIERREQDHSKATYTKILTRDDGFIPPEILKAAREGKKLQSDKVARWQGGKLMDSGALRLGDFATIVERFIRAMSPWPGAWTNIKVQGSKFKVQSKRLKILKAHLEKNLPSKLVLDVVQLEGKKPVSWKQFQEGYPEAKFL